jgi:hypothetical protein
VQWSSETHGPKLCSFFFTSPCLKAGDSRVVSHGDES